MFEGLASSFGRWIFLRFFYKGPVYNRYQPFPNPYSTAFGRIHLALHLLFYAASMVLAYAVCHRFNVILYDGTDRQSLCIGAFFFLTFRFLATTWMLVSSDWSLSTGNYGVWLPCYVHVTPIAQIITFSPTNASPDPAFRAGDS